MRYVPNLIPEKSKVLPKYFKGSIYKPAKKNLLRDLLLWSAGLFFILAALAFINHLLLFIIMAFLGFMLIPPGHHFLEKMGRFRLTSRLKGLAASALFVASLPLIGHYSTIDQQVANQQKLIDENRAKEKAMAAQKDQERKDSLQYYIQLSNHLKDEHKTEEATRQLQYALNFVSSQSEKDRIEKEKTGIAALKAISLVKAGKYEAALSDIDYLLMTDPTNPDLLYNRAICYSNTGTIQEAVNDLKLLIQSGNVEAEKLHDQINPIRKRVAYYVTRCWDGTTSSAKGRGACSHHGGVKNWNEPVYEEYRKYE